MGRSRRAARTGAGRGLLRLGRRAPRWLGPVARSILTRKAARLLLARREGAGGDGEVEGGADQADGGRVPVTYLLAPPDPPAQ